jgi:hypothetical protein
MDAPPSAGRWTLNRIVAVVLAAGFLFLLADTRLEHEQIMARKPLVFIPMAFSLVAFLVALAAAIRWRPLLAKMLLVVSLLAVPVGLGGLWFHNEDRLAERGEERRPGGPPQVGTEQRPSGGQSGERQGAQPGQQQVQGAQPPAGEPPAGERQRIEPERRQRRRGPPMLAPLAFLGMGLMGTLVTLRRWPADVA